MMTPEKRYIANIVQRNQTAARRIAEAQETKIREQNEQAQRDWENRNKLHSLEYLRYFDIGDIEHKLLNAEDDDSVKVQIVEEINARTLREMKRLNGVPAFPDVVKAELDEKHTQEVIREIHNGNLLLTSKLPPAQVELELALEKIKNALGDGVLQVLNQNTEA